MQFPDPLPMGEIITRGRIISTATYQPLDYAAYSALVIGSDIDTARQLLAGLDLPMYVGFYTTPFRPLYGLRFERAYVDVELSPEVRTAEEDQWFRDVLPQNLLAGAKMTYVAL